MNTIKIIFLIIVTTLGLNYNGFSQSKIDGIGIFKIDKTTISVIDSLVNQGYQLKTCNDMLGCSSYKITGMTIAEKIGNKMKPETNFPLIPENRIFAIGEYNVAGIEITNLELRFYKDTLYQIKSVVGDLELQTALQEKYEETVEVDKKEILCSSVYGEFKEEEVRYLIKYRDDQKIHAMSSFSTSFDDKCKKKTFSFTAITNPKTDELVKLNTDEILKTFLAEEQLQKKIKLDSL